MAENNPNLPGGSLPPRPSDSKVLPKKETVRINLPPKPSAAPTIKLPTLPPGGPSTSQHVAGVRAAPSRAAAAAPASRRRPAPGPAPGRLAASRPAPAPTIKTIDKVLAIAAAVAALAAIGSTVFVTFFTNWDNK